MPVGLLHLDQHALQQDGVVVLPVDREAVDVAQHLVAVDQAHPAVDPHRAVAPRDHEQQPHVGVLGHVQVGLEEAVAGHVRDQQVALVQDGHESGATPLGRGVAAPGRVRGGHHQEGRPGDELPHVRVQVGHHLFARALGGLPEPPREAVVEGIAPGGGRHGRGRLEGDIAFGPRRRGGADSVPVFVVTADPPSAARRRRPSRPARPAPESIRTGRPPWRRRRPVPAPATHQRTSAPAPPLAPDGALYRS